jgi:SAM-dependent methyltransferase
MAQESSGDPSAPTERFTIRADAYRRYRPGYPPALVAAIRNAALEHAQASRGGVVEGRLRVADIGSGTGLSARPFLEAGDIVIGVEPNAAMRRAGDEELAGFPRFSSIDGTAEATNLPDGAVALITVGQALHWFRLDDARREFARIAAPGARLAVFWNTRDGAASDFMAAYEGLVERHATDFRLIFHGNVPETAIHSLFQSGPDRHHFIWDEPLDLDALIGRTRSASYLPSSGHALDAMLADLTAIFERHADDGLVDFHYRSDLWLGAAPLAETLR